PSRAGSRGRPTASRRLASGPSRASRRPGRDRPAAGPQRERRRRTGRRRRGRLAWAAPGTGGGVNRDCTRPVRVPGGFGVAAVGRAREQSSRDWRPRHPLPRWRDAPDPRLTPCGPGRVILTPHVAGYSPEIAGRHLETLLDNVGRFVRGEPLRNVVDK